MTEDQAKELNAWVREAQFPLLCGLRAEGQPEELWTLLTDAGLSTSFGLAFWRIDTSRGYAGELPLREVDLTIDDANRVVTLTWTTYAATYTIFEPRTLDEVFDKLTYARRPPGVSTLRDLRRWLDAHPVPAG